MHQCRFIVWQTLRVQIIIDLHLPKKALKLCDISNITFCFFSSSSLFFLSSSSFFLLASNSAFLLYSKEILYHKISLVHNIPSDVIMSVSSLLIWFFKLCYDLIWIITTCQLKIYSQLPFLFFLFLPSFLFFFSFPLPLHFFLKCIFQITYAALFWFMYVFYSKSKIKVQKG